MSEIKTDRISLRKALAFIRDIRGQSLVTETFSVAFYFPAFEKPDVARESLEWTRIYERADFVTQSISGHSRHSWAILGNRDPLRHVFASIGNNSRPGVGKQWAGRRVTQDVAHRNPGLRTQKAFATSAR